MLIFANESKTNLYQYNFTGLRMASQEEGASLTRIRCTGHNLKIIRPAITDMAINQAYLLMLGWLQYLWLRMLLRNSVKAEKTKSCNVMLKRNVLEVNMTTTTTDSAHNDQLLWFGYCIWPYWDYVNITINCSTLQNIIKKPSQTCTQQWWNEALEQHL